jgi:hypothetical protein
MYGEDTLHLLRSWTSFEITHTIDFIMMHNLNYNDQMVLKQFEHTINTSTLFNKGYQQKMLLGWYRRIISMRSVEMIQHLLPMYVEKIIIDFL